jgi:DNA-directed RNA polymerase subunit alpha
MDLKRKGFQLPDKIRFDEETLIDTYGKLIAEPLERGYGTTIGNALRRVLLSSIEGAAVTAVKIHGALHEFSKIDGVKEDVIDIILNMKKLRFKLYSDGKKTATIKVKGPKDVTGSDIHGDASFEILNTEQVIATIDKDALFEAEMHIKKGKGYVPSELNKEEDLPVDIIAVDSVFTPIKKVNFTVEKARVGQQIMTGSSWRYGLMEVLHLKKQFHRQRLSSLSIWNCSNQKRKKRKKKSVLCRTIVNHNR